MRLRVHHLHRHTPLRWTLAANRFCRIRVQVGRRSGRIGAALLTAVVTLGAAQAGPPPFVSTWRAFTASGEVRVFDAKTLWTRPLAGGEWRSYPLPHGKIFDVDNEGDRLWMLDKGGVMMQEGSTLKRLPICAGAGSLFLANGTIWCAHPADSENRVAVARYSLEGLELERWLIQVPLEARDAELSKLAQMARMWWVIFADEAGGVAVSYPRSDLLLAPIGGQGRVVPWVSPLEEFRRSVPQAKRLPESHITSALLLSSGRLLLLCGITGGNYEQGTLTRGDRLVVLNRDGTVDRSLQLPKRAAALVRDPGGPLILYQDDTVQPFSEILEKASGTPGRS